MPKVAAMLSTTATTTCQACASPDAMRAGIRIGDIAGSIESPMAIGLSGFETTQKNAR